MKEQQPNRQQQQTEQKETKVDLQNELYPSIDHRPPPPSYQDVQEAYIPSYISEMMQQSYNVSQPPPQPYVPTPYQPYQQSLQQQQQPPQHQQQQFYSPPPPQPYYRYQQHHHQQQQQPVRQPQPPVHQQQPVYQQYQQQQQPVYPVRQQPLPQQQPVYTTRQISSQPVYQPIPTATTTTVIISTNQRPTMPIIPATTMPVQIQSQVRPTMPMTQYNVVQQQVPVTTYTYTNGVHIQSAPLPKKKKRGLLGTFLYGEADEF